MAKSQDKLEPQAQAAPEPTLQAWMSELQTFLNSTSLKTWAEQVINLHKMGAVLVNLGREAGELVNLREKAQREISALTEARDQARRGLEADKASAQAVLADLGKQRELARLDIALNAKRLTLRQEATYADHV